MGEGSGMTRTTWEKQELPFLQRLAEPIDHRRPQSGYYDFATSLGLTNREATDMLKDLKLAGYIVLFVMDNGGDRFVSIDTLRLAPDGRRLLGLWPRDESQAEQLVTAMVAELDERLAAAETEEERSKLRAVLSGLGGASRDIAVSVLAEVAKRSAGLS
jgi:hypothetical protein